MIGPTTPAQLRQLCGGLARAFGGSALEWNRVPLPELRLWYDVAVKESRERRA